MILLYFEAADSGQQPAGIEFVSSHSYACWLICPVSDDHEQQAKRI